jgi:hypothetical protein
MRFGQGIRLLSKKDAYSGTIVPLDVTKGILKWLDTQGMD